MNTKSLKSANQLRLLAYSFLPINIRFLHCNNTVKPLTLLTTYYKVKPLTQLTTSVFNNNDYVDYINSTAKNKQNIMKSVKYLIHS